MVNITASRFTYKIYGGVIDMATNIKKMLFKDYLRERRDEHISAIMVNVEQEIYTTWEASSLLADEAINNSIRQQYKVSQAQGGIMIGKSIFINCRDLEFVTDKYLNASIETVLQEINRKDLRNELEELAELNENM